MMFILVITGLALSCFTAIAFGAMVYYGIVRAENIITATLIYLLYMIFLVGFIVIPKYLEKNDDGYYLSNGYGHMSISEVIEEFIADNENFVGQLSLLFSLVGGTVIFSFKLFSLFFGR
ncbi:MAG: hypothetical protein WCK60_01030 [Candidatus Nomurabacteria bacterium]